MSTISSRQPAIFLPHGGGPCFFMDWSWGPANTWDKTRSFLENLASTLPEPPRALLVVTAHWEEAAITASAAAQPDLIYDYNGFPAHTYELSWPAPGEPALAARAVELLQNAGLPANLSPDRGFDHGVFVPMKVAFPEAKIPTVSLSLAASLDPALHQAVGRALAPLRDEGVLIVASGMSFHNLRAYLQPATTPRAEDFDAWLTTAIEQPGEERTRLLNGWRNAPAASFAHPREEHLLPLMVAAGAGGEAPGRRIFHDQPMGAALSAYRFD
ncbi:DODA-type extradiol aromatic ring-opening family dioxygenase [Telmatobacter bradus]|uniref:DODA-type extradiol aromatic ring-opening family dioxygenase n=1 Tax=Telmatobacter bradus TaxID=474953 RepID=UPI003B42FA11